MKKGCLITVIVFLTLLLAVILLVYLSDRPIPIPKDKESFIGIWNSSTGFAFEIEPKGFAKILKYSDSDTIFRWLPGRTPRILFGGDSLLILSDPFNLFRSYKINRLPYRDSSTFKMVLNGVILTK
jgi:hypothetical protein